VGHMAAPELTSAKRRGTELRDTWQHRNSPQQGGEVQARGTRGSTGAHLIKEARSGVEGHVAAPELTLVRRRGLGHGTRGSVGARLSKETRSGATGHMVAPKPTSVGRCGLKLQHTWQRVDARTAPCLNLEFVCGGT
jgi:hypothetical protein